MNVNVLTDTFTLLKVDSKTFFTNVYTHLELWRTTNCPKICIGAHFHVYLI